MTPDPNEMLGVLQFEKCGRLGAGSWVVKKLELQGDMLESQYFAPGVDGRLDVPKLAVV